MERRDANMIAEMERRDAEMERRDAELMRRIESLERNICSICNDAQPNMRIACGHIFCVACAQRFTNKQACPFRCPPPGGVFIPSRNIRT